MEHLKSILKWGFLFCCLCLLWSCQTSSTHSLRVAATSVPHAELLEYIKPELETQGIDLEILVVDDYHLPNRALQDGDVDANFFQHQPFLDSQKQDFHYQLEAIAAVHLEPMGLYSKKVASLDHLDHLTVAIPSDPTNQARALNLMAQLGLIQLNRHDSKASILDVQENPYQLNLIEMDAPLLARALEDVDLAAITTNFALQAHLSPQQDALALEPKDSLFVNLLVIRQGEEQREDLLLLKKVMTSSKMRTFIEQHYKGSIIPAF